ncbi:hypothetical protein [Streptomyces aureoversilis]|uniref:Uncharacterized protein n=1 Tax=Streptomyces aureoversilis TaxID=67277 RepID=A0ABW0A2C5_9ACTN
MTSFGCPASRPQHGEELLYCAGPAKAAPADEWQMPCDVAGGASGGPWPAGFDASTGPGTLVPVSSHSDALDGGTSMFGPVLGAQARKAYERAQRA